MSQSPANGKGAAAVKRMSVPASGNGGSARASVDKGKTTGLTAEQQKKVVILSAALVVILTFLGLYTYFTYLKKPTYTEPALNGSLREMVKFVGTSKYDQLQFDRWMMWAQTIEDKKKEVRELYSGGNITKDEMVNILSIAWVAKEYKQMNQYYSRVSPIARKTYLRELIDKERIDDEQDKAKPEDPSEAKRDKKKSKALIDKFPSKERQEYDAFKQAYDDVEKEVDKERKAAKKAAERAATRPTTRAAATQPAGKAQ